MGGGVYRSASAEATAAFGEVLAGILEEGDVVILEGDLGAGKTQMTKGIARGLGASGQVTSPTFNILITHPGGRVDLHHFDLYRIGPAELDDTGIYDLAGEDGVCVIEWGRGLADRFAPERLELTLTRDPDDDSDEPARLVEISGVGARGEELARLLAQEAS